MGTREIIKSILENARREILIGGKGFVLNTHIIHTPTQSPVKAVKEISKYEVKVRFVITPVKGEFLLKNGTPNVVDAIFHVWQKNLIYRVYGEIYSEEKKGIITFIKNSIIDLQTDIEVKKMQSRKLKKQIRKPKAA